MCVCVCVCQWIQVGFGSDNGLSPTRRQVFTWTNVGLLPIGPQGTNFTEILIKNNTKQFRSRKGIWTDRLWNGGYLVQWADVRWTWRLIHMKYIAMMSETIFMYSTKELLVHLSCKSYEFSHEVHMKFKSFEIHMNFICISCELFMSLKSTSLVLHGYNILTSIVPRYEVLMIFIRTACKFIWINLISFHMKFMRSSFVRHTKFIWTSREFHMNKFDFIACEIRKKFIWTSY